MEYKLNILGALHWYTHKHKITTMWTGLRVQVVSNYFLGVKVNDEDADWITDQLNINYLNRLKEKEDAACYHT